MNSDDVDRIIDAQRKASDRQATADLAAAVGGIFVARQRARKDDEARAKGYDSYQHYRVSGARKEARRVGLVRLAAAGKRPKPLLLAFVAAALLGGFGGFTVSAGTGFLVCGMQLVLFLVTLVPLGFTHAVLVTWAAGAGLAVASAARLNRKYRRMVPALLAADEYARVESEAAELEARLLDLTPPLVDGPLVSQWLPDPLSVGRLRFWDGARWTRHTH